MHSPKPQLLDSDFSWLPSRYRFEKLMSEDDSGALTVLARDTTTDDLSRIELVPEKNFDSDGLFRLEHYFGCASRLKLDGFIAPTDNGIVSNESGREYVYMARPPADGTTLADLLSLNQLATDKSWETNISSESRDQLIWMKKLLEVVDQFHALGITHQDFRTAQLLVDSSGPKLVCPGLQLFTQPECRDKEWSLAFVKSASPELLGLIEHDVNNRSDIYSAGVLIYCMLSRKLPFDGESISQVLSAHLTKGIEDADTSPARKIVARMLQKIPHERYQSISTVLSDIHWILENDDSSARHEFVAARTEIRDSIGVPTFVGRDKERAQLREVIDEVREGASRIILVKGESGTGKTRLVEESIKEARQLGMRTFQCEAMENFDRQSDAPLSTLISGIPQTDIAASLKETLDHAHEDIHWFFPQFANAIGLRETHSLKFRNKTGKGIEPDQSDFFEVKRRSRATCSILSNLASPHRPAVIWIDDSQWLDDNTLETLRELVRWETDSLLIILSTRTSREQPDATHVDINFDLEIETTALSDETLTQLVDSMTVALPKRAIETVVRLAAGSPFMAEAILREIVETGALILKDAQWHVDQKRLNRVEASSDATEALLHRLEQSPKEALEHLSVAAIIGKSFLPATVAALSGSSLDQTRRHLDWAQRQRLTWSRPDGTQAFVHERIRLAMLEKLQPAKKVELHTKLAEHLEAEGEDPFKIAIHFDNANLPLRALSPALAAARRAQEASALSASLQMYQIAWKGIAENDPDLRSQIAERIGSVQMLAGKYEQSDRWFEIAEEYAESDSYRAQIIAQRGELAFKRGEKADAVALLENAMKLLQLRIPKSILTVQLFLARELTVQLLHSLFPAFFLNRKPEVTKKHRIIWKMYSRLAHCYWYTKGKSVVLWAHLAGLNRAETGPATRELAQAWSEHAPAMGLVPWFQRGANYSSRSLKIRRELKDDWGEGQSRNYFSILLYATARFAECISQATKAEEILSRTGDYWELNIARYQRAASLYRQGNLKEAFELAKETRLDAIRIGDHQSTGNILDVLVRASLGKIPFEYIATEKCRAIDDRQLMPQLLLAEGVYYLKNGCDPTQAIACFERALEVVRQGGVSNCYTAPNAAWLATALRHKIAYDRKTGTITASSFRRHFRAAKRAVKLGKRFQNDLPHALREMGHAWADRNNQVRARKCLLRSLKIAQAQNARYEAALTQQSFEKMDQRFGWRETGDEFQAGNHEVREIEATVRLQAPRETVSIVNRFDALLNAGRKITSALGKKDILEHTVESAEQMLHGQTTLVILPNKEQQWAAWNSSERFDRSIVDDAIESQETIVRDHEVVSGRSKTADRGVSVLCCPIVAKNEVVACIYISNRLIESMFGANEIRIAEFIGNAAGSSLEKEASFRELDQLNASLEQKVLDRTKSLQSRTRELEITAQQLRATQHRLENAVQSAESANKIKSDFLAKMSHEIRTPITAVLGFTQLILRGIVSEPEEQLKKIKSIESSGKHLLQLVNDLLDISKIEAEKTEIERIECRPLNLLSEVVESLRSKASEGDNELNLDVVAPIPATIQSDPKRLRQVVTNILGNAIKFTSNGTVNLEVSFAEVNQRGILKLKIIDTGIGMTPEQLENVFDPFVQADSSITRRFGGTGLGLSISQKLVRALGGEIDVISRLGEGSTFTISFDVGEFADLNLLQEKDFDGFFDRQNTSQWFTADLSSMRILLVDDAKTNRDLISLVLRDCGASITQAENGQEAVDIAMNNEPFDVILMDMQMPILDGYSATSKLRSEGYDGRIFALTANSMKGDREKCLAAGCSGYLTKPIDLNGLIKSMAELAGASMSALSFDDNNNQTSKTKTIDTDEAPITDCELIFDQSDLPDHKTVRKFTFSFIKKLGDRLVEFETSLAARDQSQVASLAHWLKGTSGTVMLSQLSTAACELEEAVRDNDWDAADAVFGLIEVYSDKAIQFSESQTSDS